MRLKAHFVAEKFIGTRILVKFASFWKQKVSEGILNLLFEGDVPKRTSLQSLQKTDGVYQTHALEVEEAFKLNGSLDSSQSETEIKYVHKTADQFRGSVYHIFSIDYTPLIIYFSLDIPLQMTCLTDEIAHSSLNTKHGAEFIFKPALQTPKLCQSQIN